MMQDILGMVVRLCGLFLLFLGLLIAILIFNEALSLHRKPETIERMRQLIEAGSHIDKSIATIGKDSLAEDEKTTGNKTQTADNDGLRLSYFIAWIIQLLLLIVLARMAIMAVKTGGELVLYDTQMKRFAKHLIKAANKDQH